MQKSDSSTYYRVMRPKSKGPGNMAKAIEIHRLVESMKPKGKHICYDPCHPFDYFP